MTGYGETGPMAPHFSLGPILEAYGGLDDAMGYIGEGPSRLGIAYPDAVGGVHGAYATLAALWERASPGRPRHVDLSQLETLVAVVGEGLSRGLDAGHAAANASGTARSTTPRRACTAAPATTVGWR